MSALTKFIFSCIALIATVILTVFLITSYNQMKGNMVDKMETAVDYVATVSQADINNWSNKTIHGTGLDTFIKTFSTKNCYIYYYNGTTGGYYFIKPGDEYPPNLYKVNISAMPTKINNLRVLAAPPAETKALEYNTVIKEVDKLATVTYTIYPVYTDTTKVNFAGFYIYEE